MFDISVFIFENLSWDIYVLLSLSFCACQFAILTAFLIIIICDSSFTWLLLYIYVHIHICIWICTNVLLFQQWDGQILYSWFFLLTLRLNCYFFFFLLLIPLENTSGIYTILSYNRIPVLLLFRSHPRNSNNPFQ